MIARMCRPATMLPLLLVTACATAGDAALERRREALESEVADLRGRIRTVDAELSRAFESSGRAAEAAGLGAAPCAAMTVDRPDVAPPRDGTKLLRFTMGRPAAVAATFEAPRTVQGRRVSPGTCRPVKP